MIRILHISDVHFGPPHLEDRSREILALEAERQPDLVVVSGDLTQRAKPDQFRQAREFVDGFRAPTIVVPGNHDVPMYRFWERFLTPYGAYRKHFDTELEPVLRTEKYLAAGINTAHGWTIDSGRFRKQALRRVEEALASAPPGAARIVVAHHNLVPPPRFERQKTSRNAAAAIDLFSRSEVDLVLSGHNHQSFVATSEEFYPTGRPPVVVLHSGTTTSSRGRGCEHGHNTAFWIELGESFLEISRLRWESGLSRFAEQSRHVLPRRTQSPHSLDGIDVPRVSGSA